MELKLDDEKKISFLTKSIHLNDLSTVGFYKVNVADSAHTQLRAHTVFARKNSAASSTPCGEPVEPSRNPPTRFLTAATLIYAIGAGIISAAGTRFTLQWIIVKGFKLYSFQATVINGPFKPLKTVCSLTVERSLKITGIDHVTSLFFIVLSFSSNEANLDFRSNQKGTKVTVLGTSVDLGIAVLDPNGNDVTSP